jgi:phage replication initiation protein
VENLMTNIKDVSHRLIDGNPKTLPEFLLRKENVIIYDWFSGTSKEAKAEEIIEFLGLQDLEFQKIPGFYGYSWRYYYDGISIHFDGHIGDMGVCLEMSGQGCRVFETFGTGDWNAIFKKFCVDDNSHKVTRLDVAYDDFTRLIPLEKIAELVRAQQYISKATKWTVEYSSDGLTVYIGSKKSDILIRFYDKAAERGYDDEVHWVRCEIQLRRERADGFINCDRQIGEKFAGVLNNYLRFVDENPNDSNKNRWATSQFWLDFVQTVEKISIYTKKNVEYNFDRVERHVMHQCGNNIETMIKCVGEKGFMRRLKKRSSELTERHQLIIDNYNREKSSLQELGKQKNNSRIERGIENLLQQYQAQA